MMDRATTPRGALGSFAKDGAVQGLPASERPQMQRAFLLSAAQTVNVRTPRRKQCAVPTSCVGSRCASG